MKKWTYKDVFLAKALKKIGITHIERVRDNVIRYHWEKGTTKAWWNSEKSFSNLPEKTKIAVDNIIKEGEDSYDI